MTLSLVEFLEISGYTSCGGSAAGAESSRGAGAGRTKAGAETGAIFLWLRRRCLASCTATIARSACEATYALRSAGVG
jgi:hypothetical protein